MDDTGSSIVGANGKVDRTTVAFRYCKRSFEVHLTHCLTNKRGIEQYQELRVNAF